MEASVSAIRSKKGVEISALRATFGAGGTRGLETR